MACDDELVGRERFEKPWEKFALHAGMQVVLRFVDENGTRLLVEAIHVDLPRDPEERVQAARHRFERKVAALCLKDHIGCPNLDGLEANVAR